MRMKMEPLENEYEYMLKQRHRSHRNKKRKQTAGDASVFIEFNEMSDPDAVERFLNSLVFHGVLVKRNNQFQMKERV